MFKQVFAALGVLVILGGIIALSEMDLSASEDGFYSPGGVIPADVGYCVQDCPDCESGVCPPSRRFRLFGNNRREITRNGNVNIELFNSRDREPQLAPVPQGDFSPINSDEMADDFAEDYAQPNDVYDVEVNEAQPRRRLFNRERQVRELRPRRQGFLRRFFSCLFNRGNQCQS
jgi:hypothetical protein